MQHGLAERSKDSDSPEKKILPFRSSIGSIIDLCEHFDSVAARVVATKPSFPEVAVISRDKADQRFWSNEQDVVTAIGEKAQKIYSEELSFREQISVFNNAKTIIAQHGAGLANSIFCKPGTRVIEVTSRSHARRAWDFGKLAIARGLEYHVVVIDAVLDDPFVNTQTPAERIPPCYASDLRASDEAIRFLVDLCSSK
ncbi:MAG: glycosyltransferase 61 family protein [Dinoroseobacter sp.]|nr:glycosyltransferase 61 family protein [Dinoroseobacter sp.]